MRQRWQWLAWQRNDPPFTCLIHRLPRWTSAAPFLSDLAVNGCDVRSCTLMAILKGPKPFGLKEREGAVPTNPRLRLRWFRVVKLRKTATAPLGVAARNLARTAIPNTGISTQGGRGGCSGPPDQRIQVERHRTWNPHSTHCSNRLDHESSCQVATQPPVAWTRSGGCMPARPAAARSESS